MTFVETRVAPFLRTFITQEEEEKRPICNNAVVYDRERRLHHSSASIDPLCLVNDTALDQTATLQQLRISKEERDTGRLILSDNYASFRNDISVLMMARKERKPKPRFPHKRAIICTQRLYNLSEAGRHEAGRELRHRLERRDGHYDILPVSKVVKSNPAQMHPLHLESKKQEGRMRRDPLSEASKFRMDKKHGLRVDRFKSYSGDAEQRFVMLASPTESTCTFSDKSYASKQESVGANLFAKYPTAISDAANVVKFKQDFLPLRPTLRIDDLDKIADTLRDAEKVVISVGNDNLEVEVCFGLPHTL